VLCEGGFQRAEVLYEAAIVAGKAKEAPQRVCRRRLRPRRDGLHLVLVHGHPCRRDDMVEVGDILGGEGTLGRFTRS
jgi:hypothetical protein